MSSCLASSCLFVQKAPGGTRLKERYELKSNDGGRVRSSHGQSPPLENPAPSLVVPSRSGQIHGEATRDDDERVDEGCQGR